MSSPIFFVTPDASRTVGLALLPIGLFLVTERKDYTVAWLQSQGIKTLVLSSNYNNTGKMLEDGRTVKFLSDNSKTQAPNILIFKPSDKIDLIVKRNGYKLIANQGFLNKKFEDKVSFYRLCVRYKLPIPDSMISKLGELSFWQAKEMFGLPFIVQFGRGWAGSTTFFIYDENKYLELQKKFFGTVVKFSQKIDGITVLNNACVTWDGKVLISEPAVQIAGSLFGGLEGSTFGRQWGGKLISNSQKTKIRGITQIVGSIMAREGYLGWFGLDFVISQNGKVLLSENNARLTASFSFYTQLEVLAGSDSTLLSHHIASFLREKLPTWQNQEFVGSQVSLRGDPERISYVKKSLPQGVYNENLGFCRYGVGVRDLKKASEVYIGFPQAGERLPKNSEIVSLEMNREVIDRKHNLYPETRQLSRSALSKVNCE